MLKPPGCRSLAASSSGPDPQPRLTAAGAWTVSLSQQWVNALGSGQVAVITADVAVPGSLGEGETVRIQVMASDVSSEVGLRRDAVITFVVEESGGGVQPTRVYRKLE